MLIHNLSVLMWCSKLPEIETINFQNMNHWNEKFRKFWEESPCGKFCYTLRCCPLFLKSGLPGKQMLHFASGNFLKFKPDFWSNGKRPCFIVFHSAMYIIYIQKFLDFCFGNNTVQIFKHPRYLQKVAIELLNIAKAASFLYGANSTWDTPYDT